MSKTVNLKPESNGDLTITFMGTLQSASEVDGPFEEVLESAGKLYDFEVEPW